MPEIRDWRFLCSVDPHQRSKLGKPRRADPGDAQQSFHRLERAGLLAVLDDGGGQRRAAAEPRLRPGPAVEMAGIPLTAGPAVPGRGTKTRSPGPTDAARFSASRSAPGSAPPAASIASATIALGRTSTLPGLRAAPAPCAR